MLVIPYSVSLRIEPPSAALGQTSKMTVEYECGFSIYPPLPPTPSNQTLYALFLARLRTTFSSQVHPSTSKPLLITDDDTAFYYFTLPKYPKIPANPEHCNFFLSFRLGFGNGGLPREVAVSHVLEVLVIAKEYFGERVRCRGGGEGGEEVVQEYGLQSRSDGDGGGNTGGK
ncbi:set 5 [Fusarium tjaetaba]|uniref:Set 5 n=1 Tax=Fusarium tjaetaba TaxID=1567544 RepID=A0A8H5QIA5_9HYPO|nr:set 5 [Fusarium tjaetaba]KAF5615759.1 set 5 [Fusarium tjaetaba]